MNINIALLRGVNVGKGKPVAMADLRAMMTELGFTGVSTLLRTGNIVFDAGRAEPPELEARLQQEAEARLGLRTQVFVRTAAQWATAIAHNPFPDEAAADPSHLLLVVLKQPPPPADVEALQQAIPGRERIRAWERHLYVVYPDGIADSSLTPAIWSRHLGRDSGTGRNWNTALKLAATAGAFVLS